MFNFKNLLLSTLLLATTVPAFAADDCCKDKEAKDHKACCEKMKCCEDKEKAATEAAEAGVEDHSGHAH